MKETITCKVWYATGNKTKMITVPKDCDINTGDLVLLTKLTKEMLVKLLK